MKKTIGMMAQLLDKNNIPVLEGARKKDGISGSNDKKKCHALVASSSDLSTFIVDSGESMHMDSFREFFTSMYLNSGLLAR